jgi:hypothetical protein
VLRQMEEETAAEQKGCAPASARARLTACPAARWREGAWARAAAPRRRPRPLTGGVGAARRRLLGCGARRCGVGITFEEWDGGLLAVTAVAPGSPAARSGEIAVGDELEEARRPPGAGRGPRAAGRAGCDAGWVGRLTARGCGAPRARST